MSNQPQHNIKIIRLQSGEDIISDCVMSEDDYLVQLNHPMTLLFKRGAKGTVMMMVPWLPLEVICDNIATITQDDILTFVEPKEDLIEYYGNMVEIAIESISKNDFANVLSYCIMQENSTRYAAGRLSSKLTCLRWAYAWAVIEKKGLMNEWLKTLYYGAKKEFRDTNGPFVKIY